MDKEKSNILKVILYYIKAKIYESLVSLVGVLHAIIIKLDYSYNIRKI